MNRSSYDYQRMYGTEGQFEPSGEETVIETTEGAFFDSAPEGRNPGSVSSIEAALKTGLVQPTDDPAVLYIAGKGRMGVAEALRVGHLNEAAVRIVQASDNVQREGGWTIDDRPHPEPFDPLKPFRGTPVEDVMGALMAWRSMPHDVDRQIDLAKALQGLMAGSVVPAK